jgi:hypothetical protein
MPACGLGLSATYASGAVTANFDLSTATAAVWEITAGDTVGFTRNIPAIVSPRNLTFDWNPFPYQGYVVVKSTLSSASGQLQCSEWTTVGAF